MSRPFLIFAIVLGFCFPMIADPPSKINAIDAVADLWCSIVLAALVSALIEKLCALTPVSSIQGTTGTLDMDPVSKAICDSYAEENQRLSDRVAELEASTALAGANTCDVREEIARVKDRLIQMADNIGGIYAPELRRLATTLALPPARADGGG
jgi:hypothetical protein